MKADLYFDPEDDSSVQFLHHVLSQYAEANKTDEEIIKNLQVLYNPSSWFSVISFAEQVIYG